MMTARELFVATVEDELPRFVRVLKALPADRLDYAPHEKSKKAGPLATLFSVEPLAIIGVLEKGEFDFSKIGGYPSPSPDEVVSRTEQALRKLVGAARATGDADWDAEGKLLGGKEPWVAPRGTIAWALLLDLIHHRGQISTYIRPMGGTVPSIYGPSGDSAEA